MVQSREQLSTYDPERIFNMDETGLYCLCLPNRAYTSAGRRRRARGSKAMKAKDRVTLVLAFNATGVLQDFRFGHWDGGGSVELQAPSSTLPDLLFIPHFGVDGR